MMSNAQFLFVARSYINIKRLREREREWGLRLMYECQWIDYCKQPSTKKKTQYQWVLPLEILACFSYY